MNDPIVSDAQEPLISNELNGSFLHEKLTRWYASHERPLPWRVLWKKHQNPWHIWVSEIMLQQTVIKAVIPIYQSFLKKFPSPSELARANQEEIRLAVRGLGYYRRFDLLHRACIALSTEGRDMPQSHAEWLKLPGIGAYTAAAISSITRNEPFGVVDGNVERVLCRLFDIRTAPNLPHLKKKFQLVMNDLCRRGSPGDFNQSIMELGQTICLPANPACNLCPISNSCTAYKNSSQHLAPAQKSKTNFIDVEMKLQIFRHKDQFVLFKRPSDAKFLKGTWGFATSIASGSNFFFDGQLNDNPSSGKSQDLGKIRHSITKHKITAYIEAVDCVEVQSSDNIRLIPPQSVETSLVSNLDRKAWLLFQKKSIFNK